MKFTKIEPVNQIESNLFVRHKVVDMQDGELIQKCVLCGMVINDYSNPNRIWFGDGERPNGSPAGDVYINKSANTQTRLTQYAIDLGIYKQPVEFIDCTVVNS